MIQLLLPGNAFTLARTLRDLNGMIVQEMLHIQWILCIYMNNVIIHSWKLVLEI